MNDKILNLTGNKTTPLLSSDGVVDINNKNIKGKDIVSLLTFDEKPSKEEVMERCNKLAEIAVKAIKEEDLQIKKVALNPPCWMASSMEEALEEYGLVAVYPFFKVKEKEIAGGETERQAEYKGLVSLSE